MAFDREARPARPNRGKRRKVCQFCADKCEYIDYKDAAKLRRFVSERSKILPRRTTGTCAMHQRQLTEAIKRARLIALPLVVLCIFKYSGLAALVPDGQSILMISLLAASAPAAANVTQIAQVYGHEGDYAGAINVITTLLCIGTMPLMVLLYQM